MAVNPFDALGLPARPDLTDEQVRAAWRAIAAATHPDRRDGGDVARYTAATAAYAVLRTRWGRSEAFADLGATFDDTSPLPAVDAEGPEPADRPSRSARPGRSVRPRNLIAAAWQLPARIRHGRPLRLVIRALAAALLSPGRAAPDPRPARRPRPGHRPDYLVPAHRPLGPGPAAVMARTPARVALTGTFPPLMVP